MGFWKTRAVRSVDESAQEAETSPKNYRRRIKFGKVILEMFKRKHAVSKKEEIERLQRILSVELEKIELNDRVSQWLKEISSEVYIDTEQRSDDIELEGVIEISGTDGWIASSSTQSRDQAAEDFQVTSAELNNSIVEEHSTSNSSTRCVENIIDEDEKSEPSTGVNAHCDTSIHSTLSQTAPEMVSKSERRLQFYNHAQSQSIIMAAEPSLTALQGAIARLLSPEGLDLEAALPLMRSAACLPPSYGGSRDTAAAAAASLR